MSFARTRAVAAGIAERLAELAAGDGAFAPARLAELDRREAFPAAACRALDEAGSAAHYVPARHGGRLAQFPDVIELWRAIARHDITVAVAHGKTLLGAICVWLAGSPAQAAALGTEILAGAVVAWGLTERGHGGDLLAGELSAARTPSGWRLDGEKWLINNATRGELISVLARTEPEGGPRGFSLLLVDKRRLAPGSYQCLAKELTHGIRGADISGIAFRAAELEADAVIGRAGAGIEIVLAALQLTRTLCVGLSLGAAEHALGLAVGFTAHHQLYDRRLIELPRARRTLGEAAAALVIAEVVAAVAGRSIHALTREMSVISAITKALVPALGDAIIAKLAEVMGARGYLTTLADDGRFAKLERDHRIVAIFDGSTVVNRNALINQFPALVRATRAARCDHAGLAIATDFAAPLAELDPARLGLVATGGCSVVAGLPAALAALHDRAGRGDVAQRIVALADQIGAASAVLHGELAQLEPPARDVPAAAFALAARYELVFAAAACLELWLHNVDPVMAQPAAPDPGSAATGRALWRDALWLEAALHQLAAQLGLAPAAGGAAVLDRVADQVVLHPWPAGFSLLGAIPGGAA